MEGSSFTTAGGEESDNASGVLPGEGRAALAS